MSFNDVSRSIKSLCVHCVLALLSSPFFTLGSPNLPSELPTIIATEASPVTLTVVRHMSRGRSTAKINARPIAKDSAGRPRDSKTITSVTITAAGTAADPIEGSGT